MGGREVRRETERRLDEARAELTEARASFALNVFDAYQKPARAERLISEYCERNGREALLEALRENPEQFGLRQGHVLTRDGWREDAPAREIHAKEALAGLADRADALLACARRVRALEEAVEPQLHERELARQRARGEDGLER